VNYKLLANALATLFRGSGLQSQPELKSSVSRLRLLGLFVYFHRYAHKFDTPEVYAVHKDFVSVVSLLLNSLPVNIIDGAHSIEEVDDSDEDRTSSETVTGHR
jgi:ubiquitin-protein ligase E3 C